MKLLWLTIAPLDSPGFRSTQFGVAISLEKIGWNVHLMGKSGSAGRFEGFPGYNGRVTLINRNGRLATELRHHAALWRLIFKEKNNVILFEPPHMRLIALPAILSFLRLIKAKFILDVRTPLVEGALKSVVERLNYTMAMKFAGICLPGVTVITEALKRDLQPHWGDKKKVGVWGSGVDPEMFDPQRVNAVSRGKYGLGNRFIFFYHGSISLSRGLPELIAAMDELRREHPEAALVILGDGKDKGVLCEQVRELSLEDTVYFIDTVPNEDVPKYIAMADVGVVPLPDKRYWQVSSPIKLFEYMSMQLPIVVSDIEAHREVLGDSSYAIYAKEVTPKSLCDALRSSIERISKMRQYAYMSRNVVLKNHTWAQKAESLSNFLRNFCSEFQDVRKI